MSRLSRAMKREQKRAASAEGPVAPTPIDVRVPAAGPGAGTCASIGGVPVTAAPGEEIQRAVLTHLQRIAVAAGHPVYARVHDERIGYVVPLCVEQDGSSRYTAEPLRTDAPRPAEAPLRSAESVRPAEPARPAEPVRPAEPARPAEPVREQDAGLPQEDRATQVLRPSRAPEEDAPPTFRLRTLSGRTDDGAPGTVAPPLGEFGPPPSMEAPASNAPAPGATAPRVSAPGVSAPNAPAPNAQASNAPAPNAPGPGPSAPSAPAPDAPAPGVSAPHTQTPGAPSPNASSPAVPSPDAIAVDPRPLPIAPAVQEPRPPRAVPAAPHTVPLRVSDPDPQPAPPRGYDAVAETVLGDGPQPGASADASPFAESMARVYDAVGAGRTGEAAELVRRTVAEASALLGTDHAEVLRMRELAAYIAYLAGEPERAFGLSLDVAWAYRRAGDAEAAYSGLTGAATAWRAVRDPALGQDLGRNLLGLWSDLVAEGGPAAEEAEELESARARMDRLAARAARAGGTTG
ncbi:tetratricopeptide repeat protein [Streptomyces sp. NPDC091290]|uniref:tetratricopeptide repeat protein n=1 Tax=Streptomyces sp. NPDC091290 TaxID=3365990 RepID=UPI0038009FF5